MAPLRNTAPVARCLVAHTRVAPGRAALAALCLASLAACASAPAPQLVRLPAATPLSGPEASAAPAAASALTWQLMLPVRLPDYLDRNALLAPQGEAGLQALPGVAWAEPLRESVPRLLRQDLAALLGESQVWTAPLPPGLAVQQQLRVELLELQADADRLSVLLRARWSLVDPSGQRPPRMESALLQVPANGRGVDGLVLAHRLALWQLAQRIVHGKLNASLTR